MHHFRHIPDIDDESGDEYPWSKVQQKVKEDDEFWDEIDTNLERRADTFIKYKNFKQRLCDYLIATLNHNAPRKPKTKKRQAEKQELISLEKNVLKVRSKYHNKYLQNALGDMFMMDLKLKSKNKNDDDFFLIDKVLAQKKEIDTQLSIILQALDIAITDLEEKKGQTSQDPRKFNRNIKMALALWLAQELERIGVKPTTTLDSPFVNVFVKCCKMIGLPLKGNGNQYIEFACKKINSKKC